MANSMNPLRRQKAFQWLTQLLIITLILWALSGIVYFSIVTVQGIQREAQVFIYLLINTSFNAFGVMLIVYIYQLFAQKLKPAFFRVLLLSLIIFITDVLQNELFDYLQVRKTPESSGKSPDYIYLIYSLGPILTGNLYYIWISAERKRTRKITEQEYQLLQLGELKTKAELEALQAKINPHFLYNALNSIASLVHTNPGKAEQMVLLLSKFFRYSTGVESRYFNTLENEIDMVKTYLEVEKVRFDERLHYEVFFESEDLKKCLIPQFLLQPLVENCIKHGISKMEGEGILEIKITRDRDELQISIHDNGQAFPENIRAGYGLQSTYDKLRLLCGEEAKLELVNGSYKQVRISLKINREEKLYKIPEKQKLTI